MIPGPLLFGLAAAVLIGIGLYGIVVHPEPLRKLVSFSVVGSGAFLLFGAFARRGATAAAFADPVTLDCPRRPRARASPTSLRGMPSPWPRSKRTAR